MDEGRLNNTQLLSQIALLAFMNGGEQGKTMYNWVAGSKVCYEVYQRLTTDQVTEADILRAQTIARISEYVKKNPKASEAQLKAELEKEIAKFAQQVEKLQ